METFSTLLAFCAGNSPVTGEFPLQMSVTRSFDVSFDLRLSKQLSKQSRRPWFETQLRSLWRHCNDIWVTNGSNSLKLIHKQTCLEFFICKYFHCKTYDVIEINRLYKLCTKRRLASDVSKTLTLWGKTPNPQYIAPSQWYILSWIIIYIITQILLKLY